MNADFIISLTRDSITTILLVAVPVIGVGLLVGLAVSIFQAATQLQEPTLAFVPKIIAVLLAVLLFGGWSLRVLTSFTITLWGNLQTLF
ncbi:MAG TPA: flagellar biosynthetic protein FliQ [Firmicutes bacterium]|nr:flagellar biosynthetic protein FliQ [Bacillota bacterium]